MAVLSQSQREASATIGKDRYPIPDKNHAKLAIAMINRGGLTTEQKKIVLARARAKLASK